MSKTIRGYFITGLLVVVPLYITFYVLSTIVGFMDNIFTLLPESMRPDNYLPFHVPGLGIIFTAFGVFLVGLLTANFLGKRLLGMAERVMGKVPVARMVYNSTKQFMETFFANSGGGAFNKVVLVEFPRAGAWSIGFLTSKPRGEIKYRAPMDDSVSVFIPTTPNPTTGFFIVVEQKAVIPLSMSVEDAFKVIITGGMVMPGKDEFKGLIKDPGAKETVSK